MSHYETLAVTIDGRVATVTLNRPEKANAVNGPMWEEIGHCFDALDADPAVRAVILCGAGRHFCAGLDLGVFAEVLGEHSGDAARANERIRAMIRHMQDNLTAIERCRKPVLAAVHGSCIGGGVDMICCCDMRYCSSDARFSVRETALGMAADLGTLQRLPRLVGDGIARELVYTARDAAAGEAAAIGLVNRVFDDAGTLLHEVHAIAAAIAERSPLAVRSSKQVLLHARDHTVDDGLDYVATWNAGLLSRDDVLTALQAQGSGDRAEFDD